MLQGLRIVEIEGLGPAPFCGMLLADLGAEVIVVHRKGGAAHSAKPRENPLDRGKRSIELDLKDAEDMAVARALIATADGLIEGFRPGVMERLGLGPEEMMAARPALVYGRMTGWGQDGPRSRQAGHDLNYVSLTGALWYAGQPGGVPWVPPTLLGDIGGGALYLAVGMLAGLLQARTTGRGTVVDAAIVDGASHMLSLLMSMYPGGLSLTERGQSLLDGPHWSRCYRCACGGFVSVQCLEPQFYAEFLSLLGLEGDAGLAAQLDRAQWPQQAARLEALFLTRRRDDWAALFEGSDACVAPVLSPEEAARDPHIAARGIWREGPAIAPAPRFDGKARDPGAVPGRDADGAALRAELAERDGTG